MTRLLPPAESRDSTAASVYGTEAPRNWNELFGPFVRATDLPENVRGQAGLIVLTTREGSQVCPDFQFDTASDGQPALHPDVATAWSFITALHVDQLHTSPWTMTGALVQPRSSWGGEQSWVDILKAPDSTEQDKMRVYYEIFVDASEAASWSSTKLTDPRTILPK